MIEEIQREVAGLIGLQNTPGKSTETVQRQITALERRSENGNLHYFVVSRSF